MIFHLLVIVNENPSQSVKECAKAAYNASLAVGTLFYYLWSKLSCSHIACELNFEFQIISHSFYNIVGLPLHDMMCVYVCVCVCVVRVQKHHNFVMRGIASVGLSMGLPAREQLYKKFGTTAADFKKQVSRFKQNFQPILLHIHNILKHLDQEKGDLEFTSKILDA